MTNPTPPKTVLDIVTEQARGERGNDAVSGHNLVQCLTNYELIARISDAIEKRLEALKS